MTKAETILRQLPVEANETRWLQPIERYVYTFGSVIPDELWTKFTKENMDSHPVIEAVVRRTMYPCVGLHFAMHDDLLAYLSRASIPQLDFTNILHVQIMTLKNRQVDEVRFGRGPVYAFDLELFAQRLLTIVPLRFHKPEIKISAGRGFEYWFKTIGKDSITVVERGFPINDDTLIDFNATNVRGYYFVERRIPDFPDVLRK